MGKVPSKNVNITHTWPPNYFQVYGWIWIAPRRRHACHGHRQRRQCSRARDRCRDSFAQPRI